MADREGYEPSHVPVLVNQVMTLLSPGNGGIYVDCNLGLGGHAERILMESEPDGKLVGFDWDGKALELARTHLARFGKRVVFLRKNFAEIKEALAGVGIDKVDGILLDLGLSSLQLDGGERGFSFRGDEPLDMRMDDRRETTAAHILNTSSEADLADLFYYYGEERQARKIAAAVVEARSAQPLKTTGQLVRIIEQAVPRRFHPKKIHVATLVFQALRIAVNQEFDNLLRVLADGSELLVPGGRFCVISFHSLEDRLVKRFFNGNQRLKVVTKKPVIPTEDECRENPRARSAKLRAATVLV
ncbi:MAG: 16S rRNA (cytosine(1402)-N(4))-methyltransferase RsmH [Proteobacteria bacterium]|nr:16S rRNA (cytosine(1402)-N(4))-methyltransferase RsmH [Pseudomonadota bacterium]MBU1686329.1 16S rRNA (cytosine(1402)-N(4))-methyltransferase RsmH [Pseudomonadota bacterium]